MRVRSQDLDGSKIRSYGEDDLQLSDTTWLPPFYPSLSQTHSGNRMQALAARRRPPSVRRRENNSKRGKHMSVLNRRDSLEGIELTTAIF